MDERVESNTHDKPSVELDNSASKPNPMLYALDSAPPWYLTASFAFQVGGILLLSLPYALCITTL